MSLFGQLNELIQRRRTEQAEWTDPETGLEILALRTGPGQITTRAGFEAAGIGTLAEAQTALTANPQDVFSTGEAPALPTPPEPGELVAEREAMREAGFGQVFPPIVRAPVSIAVRAQEVNQGEMEALEALRAHHRTGPRFCQGGKSYAF